ncbi:MAG: hypothetical protein BWK76_07415 [Desulfobulbaceae bacterium A2]|nr:MAG: hypothetical protein BWK76_07415 [Desulfobulbaceae bacterium A2]
MSARRQQRNTWEPTVPFPAARATGEDDCRWHGLSLRAFGQQAQDRDMDFDQTPRPWLETQILASCTLDGHDGFPDEDFFWQMELGHRLQCLVQIAALSEENGRLHVEMRCPRTDCRLEMELDLAPDELLHMWQTTPSRPTVDVPIAGRLVRLRHPRGRDQRAWLQRTFVTSGEATLAMLETLMLDEHDETPWTDGMPDAETLTTIGAALAAADPRLNFSLRVTCPDCGQTESHSLDLGTLALSRLRQAQGRLLHTIHALASHYHWSEAQILAIPPWRRARYLALIQQEAGR